MSIPSPLIVVDEGNNLAILNINNYHYFMIDFIESIIKCYIKVEEDAEVLDRFYIKSKDLFEIERALHYYCIRIQNRYFSVSNIKSITLRRNIDLFYDIAFNNFKTISVLCASKEEHESLCDSLKTKLSLRLF